MRAHIVEATPRAPGKPTLVLGLDGAWGHFALTDAQHFTPAVAKRRARDLEHSLPDYTIAAAPERKPSTRAFE